MEVEKKGGGSFPSNYLTIQQLRQRWLQQQQQSSSSSSPVVISESNHRDNDDDVECCAASSSKKNPQNDAVSPPGVTNSLSYNNNNNNNNNKKESSSSSKPNQLPTLSPITSAGGSMKKPQNGAVSPPPPPPAKTLSSSSSSSSNNNNKKPPLISEENHENVIVSSKTLNQSVGACHYKRGGGRNPNRLLTPQKPKPEPEPKDTATILNTDDDSGANDDVDNHINNKKKSKKKKSRKVKGVFPVSGPERDPKLEPEVEVVAEKEKESKMGLEVEVEESRRRRKSDKKESKMGLGLEVEVKQKRDNKVGRGFKDKRASWFHHQNNKPAVEPEKMEMDVETVVMVDKRQKPRGRRDLDNKAVWEFKPKTTSFGHKYNSNSNLVDDNVDVKAVEVDKVVDDGEDNVDVDVVKEKSRRGYRHQGQRQGKQTLKACSSFDHDKDVKESDAAGDGERRIFGRFHRQGIRRPLLETGKGKVWVKKTPTPTSSFHSF